MNPGSNPPALSLVFPVFDEAENLGPLLTSALQTAARLAPDFEIVLVDDGSRDGSRQLIDRWCRQHARIRAVYHNTNGGYGSALRSGLREARGDLVFFSDADLQFDLSEIEKLLEHSENFDIVAGYRSPRRDPWPRAWIAWVWGSLVRGVFDLSVRDIDCAFKIFRREVLETIPLAAIGAFINTEILVRSRAAGFRIYQVPVTHRRRTKGRQSGARPRVVVRAVVELCALYRDLRSR